MKPTLISLLLTGTLLAGPALAVDKAEVVKTYADIAAAAFGDSATTAQALQTAVAALVAQPSDDTLAAARAAWRAARVPYLQTEVFRFGNPVVDDWEGRVNSWPLDEGLIDYVDANAYGGPSEENPLSTLNVIATPKFRIGATEVDATTITADTIRSLHEADGIEANVASGYHAVEFLLWGQDLNGTGPGAGARPYTDFVQGAGCTGGNCDRRAAYLTAATDLLVRDLQEMAGNWAEGGAARAAVVTDPAKGVRTMLIGMGSLSYGELAGERMKLGLMLNDPEEEHDCFSDNTHNSHYYDQVGMMAIWQGKYTRTNGTVVQGPSIAEYTAARAKDAADRVGAAMDSTLAKMQVMKDTADSGEMAYDQMLAAGNEKGNKILQDVVEGLVAQTRAVEGAVAALKLKIKVEGSDSLDDPKKVAH